MAVPAAASNVVGGTARQIAWLGVLVMVPSTAWLLRRRRGVLLASSILWAISASIIFACMRWYARQPYSLPQTLFKDFVVRHSDPVLRLYVGLLTQLYVEWLGAALCLLLLSYPVLAAWLPKIRLLNRQALMQIAIVTLACGFLQWAAKWTMPWLPNIIQTEIAAPKRDLWFNDSTSFLPVWAREATSLLVVATALLVQELRKLRSQVNDRAVHASSMREAVSPAPI